MGIILTLLRGCEPRQITVIRFLRRRCVVETGEVYCEVRTILEI